MRKFDQQQCQRTCCFIITVSSCCSAACSKAKASTYLLASRKECATKYVLAAWICRPCRMAQNPDTHQKGNGAPKEWKPYEKRHCLHLRSGLLHKRFSMQTSKLNRNLAQLRHMRRQGVIQAHNILWLARPRFIPLLATQGDSQWP